MKIIRNIPALFKLYGSLPQLSRFKRGIEQAKITGDMTEERRNMRLACTRWADTLIKKFNVQVNITGQENLPEKGPVVIVSNHQGYADIIVLMHAVNNIQFGFIAKDDLIKLPLFGKWILRIGSVSIHREDPRAAVKAILEGIKMLKNGYSMAVFPEGTRSKSPVMGTFLRGALKLATKPKVPILPVTISGSYKIFEDSGMIKGAPLDVTIHKMIETKNLSKEEELHLAETLEHLIGGALPDPQKTEALIEKQPSV